jgi:hypothetical protein
MPTFGVVRHLMIQQSDAGQLRQQTLTLLLIERSKFEDQLIDLRHALHRLTVPHSVRTKHLNARTHVGIEVSNSMNESNA